MASDILHIKDSYYFEVPKVLAPADYQSKGAYPERLNLWVRLDDQFQKWEFERIYHELKEVRKINGVPLDEHKLEHDWEHWSHDHANHGKPFDVYLEEHAQALIDDYAAWEQKPDNAGESFEAYLKVTEHKAKDFAWFARKYNEESFRTDVWTEIKEHASGDDAVAEFKQLDDPAWQWSEEKLAHYNHHLSGKLLIPQPFAELRNFYQAEPGGWAISKFMVIEFVVAVIILAAFSWLARKIATGQAPKGRLWNFLEVFLVFIRDQIAAPAIGGGHHDEHGDDHAHSEPHDEHGHALAQGAHAIHAHAGDELTPHHHHHKTHEEISDEKRFTPVLWTLFFFVLLCNLFGMLPWAGSPTASFSVTLALAFITFSCVVIGGMRKWGPLGFFKNQVPSMDLPAPMAVVLLPMIFLIEMLGLFIKHGVLAVRLLANMVAGHLVILGVMGLAFGAKAAMVFSAPDVAGWQWYLVATIAVVGSTLFNILELFVAFLQAYVFTFLSALFIGASVHKH
jgi:F-type H+-transporting ATPase subunit a